MKLKKKKRKQHLALTGDHHLQQLCLCWASFAVFLPVFITKCFLTVQWFMQQTSVQQSQHRCFSTAKIFRHKVLLSKSQLKLLAEGNIQIISYRPILSLFKGGLTVRDLFPRPIEELVADQASLQPNCNLPFCQVILKKKKILTAVMSEQL